MDIALITDQTVREALHAVRYARALTGSPLTGMATVTLGLRRDGVAESPTAREWMLARVLDESVADGLAELRPAGRHPADEGTRTAAALEQARADFRIGDPRLEAWSVLRYRYVAPSPLQMREMADELGIGERTLRRRLNQGHELLADVLRERETAAARVADSGEAEQGLCVLNVGALPQECPYRGLQAFRLEDAGFFFGRESFVEQLVDAVAASPIVGVVGPSGSGKSSVIAAGLLPWLQAEFAATGQDLAVLELRPGRRPLQALTASLERAAVRDSDRGTTVLVVDQFEELYTTGISGDEQRGFLDQLLEAVRPGAASRMKLVITLRADFLGHALAYRPLADALQKHIVMLGPMNTDELARAIRLPAEKQGRSFEAGVVERFLDDIGANAGALPLLEFALTELWEVQESGWLTHAGYEAIGGAAGAVAQHAEATFESLAPEDREGAERVFVQLVQPGDGTADTRRQASRAELAVDWLLVQRLAGARLVTTGRDEDGRETAEIVHEALIHTWSRLGEWMSAARRFRLWQERLRFALRVWDDTSRDEDALLRGAQLAEAEGWLQERGADLTAPEKTFIETGLALRDRRALEREAQVQSELDSARMLRRRAVYLTGALVLVAGLAAAAAALFVRAEGTARDATARELAAASVASRQQDPERAALLALQAVTATYGSGGTVLPEAWTALAAVLPDLRLKHVFECAEWSGHAVLSPDERTVASSCPNGVRLWDARTGRVIRDLPDPLGAGELVTFSPDGRLLVSPGTDGSVTVFSVDDGAPARTLNGHGDMVWRATFSPDGNRLATHAIDDSVVLWGTDTWRQLKEIEGVPNRLPNALAFDAGSERLATAHLDGTVRVWDAASGKEERVLAGHEGRVNGVAFSPDGGRLASVGADLVVRLWDRTGSEPVLALPGHSKEILVLSFSHDGERLVTGATDDTARVWGTATGRTVNELTGHEGYVTGAVFSADGGTVYTTSADGTTRVWETESGSELMTLRAAAPGWNPRLTLDGNNLLTSGAGGRMWDVGSSAATVDVRTSYERLNDIGFSPDGTRMIVPHIRGASIFDTTDGREIFALAPETSNSEFYDAKYASGDRRIVTSGADGVIRLWDAATGGSLGELGWSTHLSANGSLIAFSPDGRWVAASAGQADLSVLPIDGVGEALVLPGQTEAIWAVAFSPDGRYLATAEEDGTVKLRDPATGVVERTIGAAHGPVSYVAFSPDSRLVAATSMEPGDESVSVWVVNTGALRRAFRLVSGAAYVAFHPSRPLIAAAGADGVTKVWSLDTGRELFSVTGSVGANYVRFTPDGEGIATTSFTGVVRIQHGILDIDDLQRLVAGRLTRWWTPEECASLLHRATCPQSPPRMATH